MPSIKVVGIDLAKSVFSITGVEQHIKCILFYTVKLNNLLAEVAKLKSNIIGM